MMKSAEAMRILLANKRIPKQLEALRIMNCFKMSTVVTSRLLDALIDKSYIKRLSLVSAQINNEICISKLITFIKNSKFLTELDISWNGIRPQHAVNLIEVIGENRQLQYCNMSWNNFMEKAEMTPQRGCP